MKTLASFGILPFILVKLPLMKINIRKGNWRGELKRGIGKSDVVVTSLLSDLLGLGYKLFVDNWYTSLALFDDLYENKTCAAGTVRKSGLKLPKSVRNEKLGRGQFKVRRKENVLVVRYQDKKKSFHPQPCTTRILLMLESEVTVMPKSLKLFTTIIKRMGGVDKNDAMIGNYPWIKKTYKWNIKIIFHFLEEALYNAIAVYSKEGEKKIIKFILFKLEVIREMLEDTH